MVEVAGVPSAAPLDEVWLMITAAPALQPAQPALDHAAHAAQIEMPPALEAMILDLRSRAAPPEQTGRFQRNTTITITPSASNARL
jgi:hypothetical protein